MANASILAAFERMWQHTLIALNNKTEELESKIEDETVPAQIEAAMNTLREEILGGEW